MNKLQAFLVGAGTLMVILPFLAALVSRYTENVASDKVKSKYNRIFFFFTLNQSIDRRRSSPGSSSL